MLTEVRVPIARRRARAAPTRSWSGGPATSPRSGAAASLQLGADGRIATAGLALTAVGDAPFAATDAEAALVGATPGAEAFAAAGRAAAGQARPVADGHGPADYKRAMVREISVRALRRAAERAAAA